VNKPNNPLLMNSILPLFSAIKAEHVEPGISAIIEENKNALQAQLKKLTKPTWDTLIAPLEDRENRLSKAWSPIGHLNGVLNSEALRDAYAQAIAGLTEYHTEFSQNQDLFDAYKIIKNGDEFVALSQAQQKTINNTLRDFKLAGVNLPAEEKQRYGEIKKRLSELSTKFSNNVLDATQGWYKRIEDKKELQGMPKFAVDAAKLAAKQKNIEGYAITLDAPSYVAAMTHADNEKLREELYQAYTTRASKQGKASDDKNSEEWQNQILIQETLALKHELALLLGFKNYAEFSLVTKMAKSAEEVLGFLNQLADTSLPAAKKEFAELLHFAQTEYQVEKISAWDVAYYSEKRRQAVFAISEEELKPYFPANKVISGLFAVVKNLYNIDIQKDDSVSTWHKDANFYRIFRHDKEIAGFYLDIYARENKRGGAWMDECRVRRTEGNQIQLPVAYLTCNFPPPSEELPSLLTHNEVTTLFHEFGHGLHHMLTKIDCPAVSGINGVAWDAVELPSQFLENWCWQKQVIPLISEHYLSGESLPDELLEKLLKAKNYQSAMQMVRQLEFSLFDFRLHLEYDPNNPQDPQHLLDEIRENIAVLIPPSYNKFQNSFSHIFAGGYAAGYYSYKWAEVLSSDAFSLFEENGIFDEKTALSFLENILEKGGSEDASVLFKRFRGREPSIEPLLRHCGISIQEKNK